MQFLWMVLLLVAGLRAERYAVLAGVGDYRQPGVTKLEGPAYDIAALRARLLEAGYVAENVVSLVDSEATRGRVLEALELAVGKLRDGDHLLFYFSGHGTSAYGLQNEALQAAIGPDSGALVPPDMEMTSLKHMAEGLIIGRRDLRPILSKLPRGAQGLVILDACYSENSAKAVGAWGKAVGRGVELVRNPGTRSGSRGGGRAAGKGQVEEYPYRNVVSLAAASKDQKALDIGSGLLRDYPTVDGKPHGVLTNSLLRGLAGGGDTNADGVVSYDELFRFVRRDMDGVPHQPQLLHATDFGLDQPALGRTKANAALPNGPAMQERYDGVRLLVRLEGDASELEPALRNVTDVQSVGSGPYEALVRREAAGYGVYDSAGALLQKVSGAREAVERVETLARLKVLRNWRNPAQTFNVQVDAAPAGATGYDRLRSTFAIGDKIRVRIASEQAAYLLLLGINKQGRVSVLFPGPEEKEQREQAAGRAVELDVEATRPAGVDHLKLIGFRERPGNWARWVCQKECPEFAATDARMAQLREMLRPEAGIAEAGLRLVTVE